MIKDTVIVFFVANKIHMSSWWEGGGGAYIHVHVHVYSVYASLVCVLIENMRDPILVMRCYRFCFVPLMYPRPSPQFSP